MGADRDMALPDIPSQPVDMSRRSLFVMATAQANSEIVRGGCPTIVAAHEHPILISSDKNHATIKTDGISTTLTAQEDERPMVNHSNVRRLTPLECERLQQFPDNWSKYGINEKGEVYELSDAARYRLQGNSIARPFWTWLMRRLAAQYERPMTIGSLFDGQGGFPLCAQEVGAVPVWSSEIEKNAVAVLKYHFPEGADGDTQD